MQRQIPVLTQDAEDHDVVLVADESDVFGEYALSTWDPRPVVGTAGLVLTAWHRPASRGGTQMQNRFEQGQGRADDRARLRRLAARSIGEAVTRTSSNDPKALREYLRSPEFEIGAFKGEG